MEETFGDRAYTEEVRTRGPRCRHAGTLCHAYVCKSGLGKGDKNNKAWAYPYCAPAGRPKYLIRSVISQSGITQVRASTSSISQCCGTLVDGMEVR